MSYEVTGSGVRLNTGSSVRISIDNTIIYGISDMQNIELF